MDRDQGKFYKDEEQEFRAEDRDNIEDIENGEKIEDIDDMKYFLELLRHIRAAIRSGASVPLTNKKIIDAEKCLMIIEDMERNLPDAVQYGMQMFAEKDRIMGDAEKTAMNRVSSAEMRANAALEKAKRDAATIVADAENEAHVIRSDAQDRADHMVSENEIVRRAHEEARVILNDARVEAAEVRLKANHDAYQLLTTVEDELVEACKSIRRRRAELGGENE